MYKSPMWDLSGMREAAITPDRRSRRRKNLASRQIKVDLGAAGGLITDLSEGGMAVNTPGPLSLTPGERLHLNVSDPRRPIQAGCELAWISPGQAGVRFLVLSENSQKSIREWLTLDAGSGETIRIAPPNPPQAAVPSPLSLQNGEQAARTAPLPELAKPVSPAPALAPQLQANPPAIRPEAAKLALQSPLHPRFAQGLQLVAQLAQVLTSAAGAAIALRNGGDIICRASAGRAPEIGAPLNTESGLSGECLRAGLTMRCDDTGNDPRVDAEACRALGVRSLIVFPVYYKDSTAGILEVLSSQPHAFDTTDLQMLPQLAELLTRLCNRFFAGSEGARAKSPLSPPGHELRFSASGKHLSPEAK